MSRACRQVVHDVSVGQDLPSKCKSDRTAVSKVGAVKVCLAQWTGKKRPLSVEVSQDQRGRQSQSQRGFCRGLVVSHGAAVGRSHVNVAVACHGMLDWARGKYRNGRCYVGEEQSHPSAGILWSAVFRFRGVTRIGGAVETG